MSMEKDEKRAETFAIGSSIYGGRPTFALVRDETESEATVTLYELLPTEQADARQHRLETRRQQSSKTYSFDKVISKKSGGADNWTWDNWVAMKIHRLSGARLRSILQLLDETLRETETDPSEITGAGNSTVLLREELGLRLSLGFIGIKPLRRVDRMRMIARGVSRMSLEECYYWFAKVKSPSTPNGSKALRTLLIENK